MQTVSVKLADQTKRRLDQLAMAQGTTPHALMVGAIHAELDRQERRSGFVQDALQALADTRATGKALDGDEVLAYMRARASGRTVRQPRARSLQILLKPGP